jgi:hypothetical protein
MNDPSIQLLEKFRALQRRLEHLETLETPLVVPITSYAAISTIVGWSSFSSKVIDYTRNGKIVYVLFYIDGVSDSVNTTVTLPYVQAGNWIQGTIRAQNNGTFSIGIFQTAGTSTVTFSRDASGSNWTASGTKGIYGEFFYITS